MKVVKNKSNKISLRKLIDNPYDYIIVAKMGHNLYALFNHDYWTWLDIKNNEILKEHDDISVALKAIYVDNLYAFETYKDFADWIGGD